MTYDVTQSPLKRALRDQLQWLPMSLADLPAAYALSQQLGWPHRLEDWQQMLSLSEGLALKTEQGILIGTGFCLNQGNFSTLGLIVIDDAWQGMGLGREMMTRLMSLAGDQTLLLVATRAGEPLYTKLGFVACQRVHQYQGVVQAPEAAIIPEARAGEAESNETVVDKAVFDETRAEVRAISSEDRAVLLAHHLVGPAYAQALDDAVGGVVIECQGELTGVALKRLFGRGKHIGPVLAANEADARRLIQALLAEMNGDFVRLDLLEPQADDWLAQWGLNCVDEVMRMHRGPLAEEVELTRFGLMTQAIG